MSYEALNQAALMALLMIFGRSGIAAKPTLEWTGGRESSSCELALDVCGGRDKVYFQEEVDPANINLLWSVQQVGDYVMFVSRVDLMALDANAGAGNPSKSRSRSAASSMSGNR
jgi:hypothetical protein